MDRERQIQIIQPGIHPFKLPVCYKIVKEQQAQDHQVIIYKAKFVTPIISVSLMTRHNIIQYHLLCMTNYDLSIISELLMGCDLTPTCHAIETTT